MAGRRPVLELLRAGRRKVRRIHVAEGISLPGELGDAIAASGVGVAEADAADLEERAGLDSHQGVVAEAEPLPVLEPGDLIGSARLLIALDSVTDPRNLGALARVAEGAGADGLLVHRRHTAPLSPAALKAAAGALEWLPLAVATNLSAALLAAKDAGMWVVGLEAGDVALHDCPLLDERVVLVAGAEGSGLRHRVRTTCDALVGIPLHGHVESLNVSTAVAVAAFHVAGRHGDQGTLSANAQSLGTR